MKSRCESLLSASTDEPADPNAPAIQAFVDQITDAMSIGSQAALDIDYTMRMATFNALIRTDD